LPALSNDGGYHWPPPALMLAYCFDQRLVGFSSHFHVVLPDLASSAYRIACPSPPEKCFTLPGTVEM
jgi:hypothetical protein